MSCDNQPQFVLLLFVMIEEVLAEHCFLKRARKFYMLESFLNRSDRYMSDSLWDNEVRQAILSTLTFQFYLH